MGVGASMKARVIRERAVLLMGDFFRVHFLALSVSLAFLTCSVLVVICFCLLGLFEIEFLLDFRTGFVLVA